LTPSPTIASRCPFERSASDHRQFLIGKQAGPEIADPDLGGHRSGRGFAVARDHEGPQPAEPQFGDGLPAGLADLVGQQNGAGIGAVDANVNR